MKYRVKGPADPAIWKYGFPVYAHNRDADADADLFTNDPEVALLALEPNAEHTDAGTIIIRERHIYESVIKALETHDFEGRLVITAEVPA